MVTVRTQVLGETSEYTFSLNDVVIAKLKIHNGRCIFAAVEWLSSVSSSPTVKVATPPDLNQLIVCEK
jgi:hypothetical protein